MKQFIWPILMLCISVSLNAQSTEAQALFSSVIEKLEEAQSTIAEVHVQQFFGAELEQADSGRILFEGRSMDLDLTQYRYVTDGETSWTYLKERNEIQINDMSEDQAALFHPVSLLQELFEGDFHYEITGETVVDGRSCLVIECKPSNTNSAFAKARVVIDSQSELPNSFTLIQKDGYRTVIGLSDLKPYSERHEYRLDTREFPDALVEDLRL